MELALKARIENYWDSRATEYDGHFGHGLADDFHKRLWLDALARNVSPPGARILDVGCGTGFLSLLLAELGFEVTGVDFSEEMRGQARDKAHRLGLNVDLHRGDAEAPEPGLGLFDAVISRHVLWTMPDPQLAVSNWMKMVGPGGAVMVIDGRWGPETLGDKARHLLADVVRVLKGGRPRGAHHKKYTSGKAELPFLGGAHPDKVRHLMKTAGLTGIWQDDLDDIVVFERKNGPMEYRITAGKKSRYLIGGFKPREE